MDFQGCGTCANDKGAQREMKKAEIIKRKNVVLIRKGKKEIGGVVTSRDAIRVGVTKKVPMALLKSKDRIPKIVDGMETDVFETEMPVAFRTSKHRPAPGGVSIGHCLFPFSRVTTSRGLIPIKDVRAGDYVLTHENTFKRVNQHLKHRFAGEAIQLSYYYSDKREGTITATSGHPILILNKRKLEWKPIDDIEEGDHIFIQASKCGICGQDIPWFYKYCDKHSHTQKDIVFQKSPDQRNLDRRLAKGPPKHYTEDILPECSKLQEQGFRVVPIGKVVPDMVAIKDGKIFAVEVEDLTAGHNLIPSYGKYPNELSKYIDDVIWIVKKREHKTLHKTKYKSGLLNGFVATPVIQKQRINVPEAIKNNTKRARPERKTNYPVHDLEIEGSHSFVASRVLVHNSEVTAGTLGMIVRKNGAPYILSNNHVLANCNDASMGDQTWQPGRADGGGPNDTIGHLSEWVPIHFEDDESTCPIARLFIHGLNWVLSKIHCATRVSTTSIKMNKVDCAISRPLFDGDVSDEILEIGKPTGFAEANVNDAVKKSGRTSAVNEGVVEDIDGIARVNYGNGRTALYTGLIMSSPIASPGDSGSVVLNEKNEVIGQLFAGSNLVTLISKISNVLDALGLDK